MWVRCKLSSLLFPLLAAVAFLCTPITTGAQEGRAGKLVSEGTRPYTDSVTEMHRRDVANRHLGTVVIVHPPEHEWHPKRSPNPSSMRGSFTPPPFSGRALIRSMSLGSSFAGISLTDEVNAFNGGDVPPDTMGAIGPSHFVQIVNGAVAFFNRATGQRTAIVSMDSFFAIPSAGVPNVYSSDPHVLYDRRSGRWFACCIDFNIDRFGNTLPNNNLILAVSRTSDPTGAWDKYTFKAGDAKDFGDYDTLGTDDNGVYFGANEFGNAVFSRMFATSKASLLASPPSLGPVYSNDPNNFSASPQPAYNQDGGGPNGAEWIVGSSALYYANVEYVKVTWSGGVPVFSATDEVQTPEYTVDASYSIPLASNQGTTSGIDTNDDRLLMATIRNGHLWTTRNVGTDRTGSGTFTAGIKADRCAAEWVELDLTTNPPSLIQSGRVFDPAATDPRYYYYPGIAVNGLGNALLGFTGSKSTEYAAAYSCQRLSGDPRGTMKTITTMAPGQGSYSYGRWGDYSFASTDPDDDMTLWTIQQYAAANVPSSASYPDRWGTWILAQQAPAPTLSNPNASVTAGQTGVAVNLTGTGLYDPGAGYPNRMAVQVTDGFVNGIKNLTWTYNSQTSVTLRFDVASNASTGTRNIILINPDGQRAVVIRGITITSTTPNLVSLSPATAAAGGAGFQLTVNGANFASNAVVQWNGSTRTTTFVSSNQLKASITSADIGAAGTASVTVSNPGGGTSRPLTFVIAKPSVTIGASFTRSGGNLKASITVTNRGSVAANNLVIVTAILKDLSSGSSGTASTLPLSVGNVPAGGSATVTLTFSGTVGASGDTASLSIRGTYTGGTYSSLQFFSLP